MSDPAEIDEDVLFLACTRPAMVGGVTMEAMGFNIIGTCILFLVAGSLVYGLVGVAFHFIFQAITKYDHNRFRILNVWLNTRGRARNASLWGGSSLSPLRLHRHYDERDLNIV
ncbi:type IV secretion system protein VirB3 [Ochrobactrum anthropi]|uniref:type IV secretion system protein VirB3 n=1 Tax=Brucella anthropi TaxID=529 RepID=UPI0015FD1357|nr:type IV secretion system protein VirB3 [Brucella anthropi]MBA8862733.1 type IV secretion system protein VirB3 [Brucella anthropi]